MGLYPYFTCELGGGMATAYHRRPYLYPQDAYAMALVKLGSGSNLLGYYMYHGGTNPQGRCHTLNECQTSPFTANNDLPVCTYDFQAPLGEFGQTYPHYYRLRPLHLFMHDFGEMLAPMLPHFPTPQDLRRADDTHLRWAVRTDGHAAFIFINNYERFADLSPKTVTDLAACGVRLPKVKIPAGTAAIFPVNVEGIRYATAQLVARRDGRLYLMQIPGIPATIALQDGKTLKNVKPRGPHRPVYGNICLLTADEAEHLFLTEKTEPQKTEKPQASVGQAVVTKIQEAGKPRPIDKGRAKVASAPTEEDWLHAAVYKIKTDGDIPVRTDYDCGLQPAQALLAITYRGDCARLYADGRLLADNFYYGRPFLCALWRLPKGTTELELRILPLQPDAPIYLPREADRTPGEAVVKVEIIQGE